MKSFSLTQHLHKRLTNNEASDDYAKDRYAKQKPQPRKLHPKKRLSNVVNKHKHSQAQNALPNFNFYAPITIDIL